MPADSLPKTETPEGKGIFLPPEQSDGKKNLIPSAQKLRRTGVFHARGSRPAARSQMSAMDRVPVAPKEEADSRSEATP
ncbi:MAG TPA: hypothetical protein VKX41_04410 [Alloacidobacterium sp.]|nr:hypothetical protein [Alloacidobacterium sp.]